MKSVPLIVAGLLFGLGCQTGDQTTPEPVERHKLAKADALSGTCLQADGSDSCGGKSNGSCWCDAECAGWGDCCLDAQESCGVNECKPEDETSCPTGYFCLPAEGGCVQKPWDPDFECFSIETGLFFDMEIVDVGDEEGTVVINDGGAPVTYTAEYDQGTASTGYDSHTFLFGFDAYNQGEIDALFTIAIDEISTNFARGSFTYDQIDGELVCHLPDTDSEPESFDYECLGKQSGTFFDLTIVDVGDEEGEVVVNDGGAPVTYPAEFDQRMDENDNHHDQFIFGFDAYNNGEIEELYFIDVSVVSINFSLGEVEYAGAAEELICHRSQSE